jgi:hypothetical protein
MMDRRSFVTTSLGAAAFGCAMPWLKCYGVLNDSHGSVLVLLDSTLAASCAYASMANEQSVRRIEVGTDVGWVWHRRLRDWPGAIRGVLRPSDCFVLRRFSSADGRAFGSEKIDARAIAFEIGGLSFAPRKSANGYAVANRID